MKRFFCLLMGFCSLSFAQMPAYIENTAGIAYTFNQDFTLQGSFALPFTPLGIETGLDLEATSTQFAGMFKANLFPSLILGDQSVALGLGLDTRYFNSTSSLGLHLGPVASMEFSDLDTTLSGFVGLGYQDGAHLAWGLGLRAYLENLAALEVSSSDRYILRVGFLYLW